MNKSSRTSSSQGADPVEAPAQLRLGDLQLRILKVLWHQGEASVADVLAGLGTDAGLAYTTVATMLRKMEARGLVAHEPKGRQFVYRALVAHDQITQSLAGQLLDRLFAGSLSNMVSHLLTHREVSRDELARLEALISERKGKS